MGNRQAFIIIGVALVALGLAIILITQGYMERQAVVQQEQTKLQAATEIKEAERARRQAEKERKEANVAETKNLAEKRRLRNEEAARQAAAKAKFERVKGGPPTNFIPAIQGKVVSFGFFQQWLGGFPLGVQEAFLQNNFHRSPATAIGWQATFNHPPFNQPVELTLKVLAYRDDGTVVFNNEVQHQIMPGWTTSWRKDAGPMPTSQMDRGRYWVDLYCNGVKIAANSFFVD